MSHLSALRFLTNVPDEHPDGYTPIEIVTNWLDEDLEGIHNYIQWCFPLVEPSNYNHGAPTPNIREVRKIRKSKQAQESLSLLMWRMIDFYDRTTHWITLQDHNHLRITRIIKSLGLLTPPEYGLGFYHFIMWKVMSHSKPCAVNSTTIGIWRKAADEIIYPASQTAREAMDELNKMYLTLDEARHGPSDGVYGSETVDPHLHPRFDKAKWLQAVKQEGTI